MGNGTVSSSKREPFNMKARRLGSVYIHITDTSYFMLAFVSKASFFK